MSARRHSRAWPLLAVLLAVCAVAPGTAGLVFSSSPDGDGKVELTHVLGRASVAAAPRVAVGERLVALPVAAATLHVANAPSFVADGERVATPAIGRPITTSAARAPPSPPRV